VWTVWAGITQYAHQKNQGLMPLNLAFRQHSHSVHEVIPLRDGDAQLLLYSLRIEAGSYSAPCHPFVRPASTRLSRQPLRQTAPPRRAPAILPIAMPIGPPTTPSTAPTSAPDRAPAAPLATRPAAPIKPPVCLPIFVVTTRPELQLGQGLYIRRSSQVMTVLSQKQAREIPTAVGAVSVHRGDIGLKFF